MDTYVIKYRRGDSDMLSLVMKEVLMCLAHAESSDYVCVEMPFMIEWMSETCSSETLYLAIRLMQERNMVDCVLATPPDGRRALVLVAYPGTFAANPYETLLAGDVVLCS